MRRYMWAFFGLCFIIYEYKVVAVSDNSNKCKNPWKKVNPLQGCYMFVKDPKATWSMARNECMSHGGDLLSLTDEAERDAVSLRVRDLITDLSLLEWWIGLRYNHVFEDWMWTDNTTLKDPDKGGVIWWATSEPNNGTTLNNEKYEGPEECGLLTYEKKLKDFRCDEVKAYVCERQDNTSTTHPSYNTTAASTPASTSDITAIPPESTTLSPTPAPTTLPRTTLSSSTTLSSTTISSSASKSSTLTSSSSTPSSSARTVAATTKTSATATASAVTTSSSTTISSSRTTSSPSTPSSSTINTASAVTTGSATTSTTTTESPETTRETGSTTSSTTRETIINDTTRVTTLGTLATITFAPTTPTYWNITTIATDEPSERTKTTGDTVTTSANVTPTISAETTTTLETTTLGRLDDFIGCYSMNYEDTCAPVDALGIAWPRTKAGDMAVVECMQGSGKATWKCDNTSVVCWRGEPNVTGCTSQAIQDLTNQADEILKSENNSAATVTFMETLADTLDLDSSSEQDLYQSTKLMATAAKANPENEEAAKQIVEHTLKCGSGIITSTRKLASPDKDRETSTMIVSSLMSTMDDINMNILNTFNTPTVVNIRQPNMEVEFHVVDLESMSSSGISSVKYEGKSNLFSVPSDTLRNNNHDGKAKLVFAQYDGIGEFLEPPNQNQDGKVKRKIISDVLSASIGQSNNQSDPRQQKTIAFTFKTEKRVGKNAWEQLCSHWNFSLRYTGDWSQKGCWLKTYNDTHTTCECNHTTNFAILMDIHATQIPEVHATSLTYVTFVGCIISIICLFLSFVTFTCLSLRRCIRTLESEGGSSGSHSSNKRSVQGERNSIHKNLVFCLFVAEVLFLAGVERTDDKVTCSIIAGFLHFFFLSSFSWMFVEGIHILFMLVQVFDSAKSRLKYYYLLGYGGPVVVVGISAAVYHQGYGTDRYCWLTTERLFLWSFAGPVAFILLVNLMILIYAMINVCKHSEYVFTKDKSKTGNMKGWIQGALALEVLLGLTWVFGYFYISEEALAVAYLFTIFNSLQGVFIFVFHCLLNKKIRKEYKKFIDYKPPTSGTHTTSKSANGTAGQGTGSTGLQMNSRKKSDFSDLNIPRHGSSSA